MLALIRLWEYLLVDAYKQYVILWWNPLQLILEQDTCFNLLWHIELEAMKVEPKLSDLRVIDKATSIPSSIYKIMHPFKFGDRCGNGSILPTSCLNKLHCLLSRSPCYEWITKIDKESHLTFSVIRAPSPQLASQYLVMENGVTFFKMTLSFWVSYKYLNTFFSEIQCIGFRATIN